jgi:NADH dehydrogenase [ubiquinone] 1 alpha subcomplex assembly factor 6
MQGPKTHTTLQSHIDATAPLQNALLLGPLPLLLPPTHPSTSSVSHTLTHLSSLLSTTSLLRSLPLNTSKRINTIPRELCVKHGLVDEELFRAGSGARGLQDACFEIGTRGMDELITARSHLRSSAGKIDPAAATPVFLSAVSTGFLSPAVSGRDCDAD